MTLRPEVKIIHQLLLRYSHIVLLFSFCFLAGSKSRAESLCLVNITATPFGAICQGDTIVFEAAASGGTDPYIYHWYLNGNLIEIDTTDSTHINSNLSNGDQIKCYVFSSSCPDSAVSNTMTITVNMTNTVSNSISILPNDTVCPLTIVTLTSSQSNGGINPLYEWFANSTSQGPPSLIPTYTYFPADGQVVYCVLYPTSACPNTDSVFSNSILIRVISGAFIPSISISANPGNTICTGTLVTFDTALTVNGGPNPSIEWFVNGVSVGTGASINTDTLSSGAQVYCIMTSGLSCALPQSVSSDTITITVTPTVTPTIAISADPGATICSGTFVTFDTSSSSFAGSNPTFEWFVNGTNAGTGSFIGTDTLTSGAQVHCVMTSDLTCASPQSVSSNTITMLVTQPVAPALTISANPGTIICAGTLVNFDTTSTSNAGTAPSFEWFINGISVGTGGSINTDTLTYSAQVHCVMTSGLACVTAQTATSNTITITVTSTVIPALTISADPGVVICTGTLVTFDTASTSHAGTLPTFEWFVNGVSVGTGVTISTDTLTNGSQVSCVMSSSLSCASPQNVTSNTITMLVSSTVAPTVTITADPGTIICTGTLVTFDTSASTNAGTTPSFQWYVNGMNVSSGGSLSTDTLTNGAQVHCVMTSSLGCALPQTTTSAVIVMSVTSTVSPGLNISADPGTVICTGTSVTFDTSNASNAGTSPAFEWFVNGISTTSGSSFVSNTLSDGDEVYCQMTSSLGCASPITVNSDTLVITISSAVVPSFTIAASPGNVICNGQLVTFAPVNIVGGGSSPSFEWFLNGNSAGSGNNFNTGSLINGDVIFCVLTSSLSCASPASVTSDTITISVNASLPVSVSVSSLPSGPVCSGTTVTFTASATNGGTSPVYQWQVNGFNSATNASIFAIDTLNNNDQIRCLVTSDLSCAINNPDTSNTIVAEVNAGPQLPAVFSVEPDYSNSQQFSGTVCMILSNLNMGIDDVNTSFVYEWSITDSSGDPVNSYYISPDQSHILFDLDSLIGNSHYLVQLNVQDASGSCSDTLQQEVFLEGSTGGHDEAVIWKHEMNGTISLVCMDNTATFYQWGYDEIISWTPVALEGQTFQNLLFSDSASFTPTSKYYWVEVYYGACFNKIYYNGPRARQGSNTFFTKENNLLYPNPATQHLFFYPERTIHGTLHSVLFNSLGQQFDIQNFSPNETAVLEISDYPKGLYLVMFSDDIGLITIQKFLKN